MAEYNAIYFAPCFAWINCQIYSWRKYLILLHKILLSNIFVEGYFLAHILPGLLFLDGGSSSSGSSVRQQLLHIDHTEKVLRMLHTREMYYTRYTHGKSTTHTTHTHEKCTTHEQKVLCTLYTRVKVLRMLHTREKVLRTLYTTHGSDSEIK